MSKTAESSSESLLQKRKLHLKEEASTLKVIPAKKDTYDFTALNISKIKTKPKEKGIKIYATQKQKESEMQKQKERDDKETKEEASSLKKAAETTTKKTNHASQSISSENQVEPADADMEPLF